MKVSLFLLRRTKILQHNVFILVDANMKSPLHFLETATWCTYTMYQNQYTRHINASIKTCLYFLMHNKVSLPSVTK